MHQTTDKDFAEFKASFLEWAEKLGFTLRYRFYFEAHPLNNAFAQIQCDHLGRSCTVTLNTELSEEAFSWWRGPKLTGRHEALHLVHSRLSWLGRCRFVDDSEIGEEDEAIVRMLERLLPEEVEKI